MAEPDGESSVERLVELLDDRLRQSEWDILTALAAADGPLTLDELVEETGYTERTVKKRLGTLEERVHGGTLVRRTGAGDPELHPQFAAAVREHVEAES
jgi:DNA-binding MarR family transcriptional regulator